MEHRIIKTDVIGWNAQQNNFETAERELEYPNATCPNGYGQFVNNEAYEKYIDRTYGNAIARLAIDPDDATIDDRPISFDLGKTLLLMILAQEGCEGIRIINCLNKDNQPTLVIKGLSREVIAVSGTRQVAKPLSVGPNTKGINGEEVHGSSLREIVRFFGKGITEKSREDLVKLIANNF